jgi:hypothetical protein
MQGRLIRVGIDLGNVGYVGPVSEKTMDYVYIPLPTQKNALVKRTYGNETALPEGKTFKGKFLSDLMHTDNAQVCVGKEDKKKIWEEGSAHSLKIHFDPEFKRFTYGDFWGNRVPRNFDSPDSRREERHLFFYAGLAPYPECFERRIQYQIKNSQRYNMNIYLIAHFKIKRIYSVEKDKDLDKFRKELATNAHFIEKEHLKGLKELKKKGHFSKLIIVKGQRKDSRGLLPKAIRLTRWDLKKRVYVPVGIGEKTGIKPNTGIRQTPHLDHKKTSILLDEINSLV